MSPLAKWDRNDHTLVERFELFVAKKELCNDYTELNSPHVQYDAFAGQSKAASGGDDEAMAVDHDYVRALAVGLHPTGGWGMGIDRFVMFMTNNSSIRDVILFPTMRPEVGAVPRDTPTTSETKPCTELSTGDDNSKPCA